MHIIEIKNLTKTNSHLTAVDNLDMKIEKGEVFGLLGPKWGGQDDNPPDADHSDPTDMRDCTRE
jgi:hypothetical protein